ncbi:para-nitrobenzyl esterase [Cricetibacter osteomyelitidis]|uniref:Carboxylic ester hydrolase n=1 Tax=Cricetibacter osteomyelitidis TaxID=1521931 RepID=A0A4V6NS86_9PAST|nr:carboxylesterase family protein [Cricetibacter osteomyelitidis]TCP95983.1 para-nitrobenzyl esterase [Cricetibacter osteomyelitidis]
MKLKKLLVLTALSLSLNTAFATNDAVVAEPNVAVANTQAGKVQGFVHNGIFNYKGIPYATAERFKAPQAVAKWADTRTALTYGNICPQSAQNPLANFMFSGPHLQQSDDCLNLNVWTPALNDGKKRPVMVWLHGGGFEAGSSIESYAYDGENLSRTGDVVVVSVNHRLNAMGYLDLSAYGDEYKHSANNGIQDLVAALKWVQTNAAAFGGDADNVTIFGESGGGAKVLTLMATPAAKGLFDKAIVQSGAVEQMGMTLLAPKTTKRVAELILQNLGLSGKEVAKLNILPYEQIAAASAKALKQTAEEQGLKNVMGTGTGLSWAPVTDGSYIPQEPVGEQYPAIAKDIPLLIGSNLTEWNTIFAHFGDMAKAQTDNHNTFTAAQVAQKMQQKYGSNAEAIAAAFKAAYPERKAADALYADSFLRPFAMKTARLKADQNGAPVYQYLFDWDTPILGGFAMSYHTAEIPFVMNSLSLTETAHGNGDEAKDLADKMSRAWVAFAKTGNPNVPGLPQWDAYTRQNGAVMLLDNHPQMRYFHDEKLMKLLQPNVNF